MPTPVCRTPKRWAVRRTVMKRTWTIIGVRDVPRSFKWYQSLFGQRSTTPAHPDFGQLLDSDGTVLLCLHEWGAHEHPSLMSPDHAMPGNGLLLFFRVDDFGPALQRARALVTRLEEEPHVNPNTGLHLLDESQTANCNGRPSSCRRSLWILMSPKTYRYTWAISPS